jgi:hypothetical protein
MSRIPYGMQITKFAVVDDTIINFRLRTIYRLLKDESYDRVKLMIINLVDIMRKTPEVRINKDRYNQVLTALMRMRILVGLKHYTDVHNLLRDTQIASITQYKSSAKEYTLYF